MSQEHYTVRICGLTGACRCLRWRPKSDCHLQYARRLWNRRGHCRRVDGPSAKGCRCHHDRRGQEHPPGARCRRADEDALHRSAQDQKAVYGWRSQRRGIIDHHRHPQTLWLDGKEPGLVEGKRIILVDDVISTGSTLAGMRKLVETSGGQVIAEAAAFTEGNDPDQWKHIIATGDLRCSSGDGSDMVLDKVSGRRAALR